MDAVSERLYGLDVLRTVAMLLGLVLHAELVLLNHSVLGTILPSAVAVAPEPAGWVWGSQVWIHLWRMPLFFVLSGFFAAMMIGRIGWQAFLGDRLVRILGATVVFSLLYSILLDRPFGQLDHLWFLWFLILCCAVVALWHAAGLRHDWGISPRLTLAAWPVAALLAAFGRSDALWHRIPDVPWELEWRGFLYYLAFFLIGHGLWNGTGTGHALSRMRTAAGWLALGTAGWAGLMIDHAGTWPALLRVLLSGAATAGYTLGLIGLCLALFHRSSPLLTWLVRGAYPIYILHLYPTLLAAALLIAAGASQVVVVIGGALGGFAAAVALWYALVRYTPLDWVISGYRHSWFKWPLRPNGSGAAGARA